MARIYNLLMCSKHAQTLDLGIDSDCHGVVIMPGVSLWLFLAHPHVNPSFVPV